MKNIKIGRKMVGEGFPPLIVAEAGINHNGEMGKAKQLIDAASKAGADAIKFQTHLPEKEMLPQGITADYVGEPLFDLLKRIELSAEDHRELFNYASEKRIMFLSTPFSREAADLLHNLGVLVFKVGSGELTNIPLLKHIARKGKPMIISTGMSEWKEIEESISIVRDINNDIILMQCTSTYPTEYKDINLKVIEKLKKAFDLPVGLSDHSIGIYTALGAIALGANIIEKHFTISREWPGPDQKASIEPPELIELVKGARAIYEALGSEKRVIKGERDVQRMARESVIAIKDIPPNTIITRDMVWVKRPGTGIPAKDLEKVIGKRTKREVLKDTLLRWEDLDEWVC